MAVCNALGDDHNVETQKLPTPYSPANSTSSLPKRRWLPREGATSGGGELHVADRALHSSCGFGDDPPKARPYREHRQECQSSSPSVGSTCSGTPEATHKRLCKTSGPWTASSSLTPAASKTAESWYACSRSQSNPEARRAKQMASLRAKQAKTEQVRHLDQARIAEKVESRKQMREERFDRLEDGVNLDDDVSFQTAMKLREFDMHATHRKRGLHRAWEEKVFQPLAVQAFERMNPPSRAGLKSVDFDIPNETFRLYVSPNADPLKMSWDEHASEEAFHWDAMDVLNGSSCSSPASSHASAWRRQPYARSRPVLEPSEWGQNSIQATRFGRFAQVVEQGPTARLGTKGGPTAVFSPDESDGIRAAGTKTIRSGPKEVLHHSMGLLQSEISTRGEAARHRSRLGASSGAPVQDHYTFETGSHVTDMEFPMGKRMYPPLF